MTDVVARAVTSLPTDLTDLLESSVVEGYEFVQRLVEDWEEGANRFDRAGEVLLEARVEGRLVAVGGLNRDPYLDDPEVGRIRHVYVHPEARGNGVGRLLLDTLVNHARHVFRRVRVRAVPPERGSFYERLGFSPSSDPDATHEVRV